MLENYGLNQVNTSVFFNPDLFSHSILHDAKNRMGLMMPLVDAVTNAGSGMNVIPTWGWLLRKKGDNFVQIKAQPTLTPNMFTRSYLQVLNGRWWSKRIGAGGGSVATMRG